MGVMQEHKGFNVSKTGQGEAMSETLRQELGIIQRPDNRPVFDQIVYLERERNVFTALKSVLPSWRGKHVLDLGCGWGAFGQRFADEGARVTFVDGRAENLDMARRAGPEHTYLQGNILDLVLPGGDITLCLGLLYHTHAPLALLKKVAQTSSMLVVETLCIDHDGAALVFIQEDPGQSDCSITGDACRPSPGWVKEALHDVGFHRVLDLPVETVPSVDGWTGCTWTWDFERTCGWRRNECQLRKLYVATK